MRSYTLSGAAAFSHVPNHPDRTARQEHRGTLDFDVTFKEWNSRKALAVTVRLQQKREARRGDWKPCVPLTDGEGY